MKRVVDFFGEVKVELEKVVWPSKELTFRLTIVVILVTITVGFFVGLVDLGLTKLLEIVLKR